MPSQIADYALIGDCETAALVGKDGSIDWLCLPRFDSPACFAALLGTSENGRWQVTPEGRSRAVRHYRPHTLILETEFQTPTGTATLIDFMPGREAHPRIIRMVRGDSGTVRMKMDLVIRFDYGNTIPWVTQKKGILLAVAGPDRLVLRSSVPLRGKDWHTISEFTVKAGQTVYFDMQYSSSLSPINSVANPSTSLKKTERLWRKWTSRCTYKGECSDDLERSLIPLKALLYAPTGGMVAAPTTSLPEQLGGARNWDYRYCWVRDATFTLLGFIHAGFKNEARRWKSWLMRSAAGSPAQMQVMYGVSGERLLREWEVPWLSGYKKSAPVRVGNAASEQLQLDVYGELADALQSNQGSRKNAEGGFRSSNRAVGASSENLAQSGSRYLGDSGSAAELHALESHGLGGI